jgi:uncharacterized protein (TIGR03083 family)
MIFAQTIPLNQAVVPDRAAIRADMEAARSAFHRLLDSLTDEALARPCAVSKWTVKEVLVHLVINLEQATPMMVKQARRSKGMPKFLATRLGHWLNYKMAVWSARKATRESLAQRYDAAHANLLNLLTSVRDEEWQRPTAYPDGRPLTMETVFHVPAEHLELHAAWIRQTIEKENKR